MARAVELAGETIVLLDTPPGVERLVRAAISHSDAVVIPTWVGGLEVSRVQATVGMLPPQLPRGLIVIAVKTRTRDYQETVVGWTEAGVPVWASVPKWVGIASGPGRPLHPDGLLAYRPVLRACLTWGGACSR